MPSQRTVRLVVEWRVDARATARDQQLRCASALLRSNAASARHGPRSATDHHTAADNATAARGSGHRSTPQFNHRRRLAGLQQLPDRQHVGELAREQHVPRKRCFQRKSKRLDAKRFDAKRFDAKRFDAKRFDADCAADLPFDSGPR
jgi:hypothetical protein